MGPAFSRLSCFSSPCSVPHLCSCRISRSPMKLTVLMRLANTNTRDLERPSALRKSAMCFRSLRAFLKGQVNSAPRHTIDLCTKYVCN